MCCISSLLILFHYFWFYHWSRSQRDLFWTKIVETVQIFEHLNKLPSKLPLYMRLMSSRSLSRCWYLWFRISGIIFVAFICTLSILSRVYVNVVTWTELHIPGGVGQGTYRAGAWVLCFCSWSCWELILCSVCCLTALFDLFLPLEVFGYCDY